jgi:RHS repeat-associated protein
MVLLAGWLIAAWATAGAFFARAASNSALLDAWYAQPSEAILVGPSPLGLGMLGQGVTWLLILLLTGAALGWAVAFGGRGYARSATILVLGLFAGAYALTMLAHAPFYYPGWWSEDKKSVVREGIAAGCLLCGSGLAGLGLMALAVHRRRALDRAPVAPAGWYPASPSNATYNPASDGTCQAATAASSTSHTYDIADRLTAAGTDAGLTYDSFGRTTTLPSADTGNASGSTTLGYYSNDLVHTQTQAGTTFTYALDANGRLASHTSSAGGTWTNHYHGASEDAPDWIAENATASNWTRNITGPDGQLVATIDQAGTVTWQISNLHGDTIATATSTDIVPSTYFLTDEYGNTITGYSTAARYGWLGGKQRAQDDLAGLTLMGVRLYSPTLGRFLSVDPVPGGSANNYAYPTDPVNAFDLNGQWWHWLGTALTVAVAAATVASFFGCAVCGAAVFAYDVISAGYHAYHRNFGSLAWDVVGIAGFGAGIFISRGLSRASREYSAMSRKAARLARSGRSYYHARRFATVSRSYSRWSEAHESHRWGEFSAFSGGVIHSARNNDW